MIMIQGDAWAGKTDEPPRSPVPGDVYLCQVNDRVSCAACCGLYNVPDASRTAMESMLADRTARFERIPREVEAIAEFGRQVRNRRADVPYPDFHHCPFVGLIGEERTRVGCLLHPLAAGNTGVDYRGLSFYGGMACRVYFCPTHHKLSREIKSAVKESAVDWYEYGLLVTEGKLLESYFSVLEHRLGAPVKAGDILARPEGRQQLRELVRLKIEWPFRRSSAPGLCHYLFDDHLYDRPEATYPPSVDRPSPFDGIFRELGSGFDSEKDLERAEGIVREMIESLAREIGSGRGPRVGRETYDH